MRHLLTRALKAGAELVFVALAVLNAVPAGAEVRTITAIGEYRMGDNDTRSDAKRLALLDAKRLALEQAGTYLESVTEVKNLEISKDEMRAYTAGIVEVMEQAARDVMEGATHIVRVEVTARIDTAVVARQISVLRENQDAKKELIRMKKEADQLRRDLEIRTKKLAAVKSTTEVEAVTQQRQRAMTQVEVNALLSRASWELFHRDGQRPGETNAEGRARARILLAQALALDPSNPRVHHGMGMLFVEEGDREGAIREFREAIRLRPDYVEAHSWLGLQLTAKDDLPGAIAAYRTIVRLKPEDPSAHEELGDSFSMAGYPEEAVAEFRTALRLKDAWDSDCSKCYTERLASLHGKLGSLFYQVENLEEAIKEFREGISLSPDRPLLHGQLGLALAEKGQRSQAAREFREYLRLAPETSSHYDALMTNVARSALRELER